MTKKILPRVGEFVLVPTSMFPDRVGICTELTTIRVAVEWSPNEMGYYTLANNDFEVIGLGTWNSNVDLTKWEKLEIIQDIYDNTLSKLKDGIFT